MHDADVRAAPAERLLDTGVEVRGDVAARREQVLSEEGVEPVRRPLEVAQQVEEHVLAVDATDDVEHRLQPWACPL